MNDSIQDYRKKELARIHVYRQLLGLDDETYRDLLMKLTGKRSAGDMDTKERWQVINHMKALVYGESPRKGYPGKPKNMGRPDIGPMLSKIEALLAEANQPWKYADSMSKRMYKVEKVQWCTPEQLHKIVAALVYNAKKQGRRTS